MLLNYNIGNIVGTENESLFDEDTKSWQDYLTQLQSLYEKELTALPGGSCRLYQVQCIMDESPFDEDTKSRRDYLTRLRSLYEEELTARPGEFLSAFVNSL